MVTTPVVVITGASSGIGRSIAVKFASLGYSVVAHGFRNHQGIAETLSQISRCQSDIIGSATQGDSCNGARPEALSVFADVSEADDCGRLVEECFRWKGRVDVWLNCAGADVLTGQNREQSFEAKLDLLWRTDVAGTIRVSRLVASRMNVQPPQTTLPCIMNISWDQCQDGMEGDSGQYFAATKAAIAAFSKSLAKSVAPKIRVNCIAPGWIKTDWGKQASPEWDGRARGESMLQRWGTPDDIASLAAALASQDLEFINGQTIAVNGGWQSQKLKTNGS